MSESKSIGGIVTKYLIQWAIAFGVLYWWIDGEADKQWYYWIAGTVCITGLLLMIAVKKIGDKAADALSKKLTNELTSDSHQVHEPK